MAAIKKSQLYSMLWESCNALRGGMDTSKPKRKRITIFTKDEKSEIEIKRSLQEMTDHNLSTLFCLNDLEIIKTANIIDSPEQFRKFMLRYTNDETQVTNSMMHLIEHLRNR